MMKEYECVEVKHHKDVDKTIAEYQKNGWRLHTYQTAGMGAEPMSYKVIPGYLMMFVFFTAALSAERIVRERQTHTLERLLTSSVKRESIWEAYLPTRRLRV